MINRKTNPKKTWRVVFAIAVVCIAILPFQNCSTAFTSGLVGLTATSTFEDLMLSSAALESGPRKIAASRDGKPNKYQYGYAPSIIWAEGQYFAYFCSPGLTGKDLDSIRVVSSTDLVTWTPPVVTLKATLDSSGELGKERSNCDPSVVRAADGYYYMFYGDTIANYGGVIGVARSENPGGPWLKWSKAATWSNDSEPSAIIGPRNAEPVVDGEPAYGAGQPTVIYRDGRFLMWYADNSVEWNGRFTGQAESTISEELQSIIKKDQGWSEIPSSVRSEEGGHFYGKLKSQALRKYAGATYKILFLSSTDGLHWTEPQVTDVLDRNSIDVKYDSTSKRYLMFSIETLKYGARDGQFDPNGSFGAVRASADGIHWSAATEFCPESTCLPGGSHNPGVVSDANGTIASPHVQFAFGAPVNLGTFSCPLDPDFGDLSKEISCWDVYLSSATVEPPDAPSTSVKPTATPDATPTPTPTPSPTSETTKKEGTNSVGSDIKNVYRFYNPNNGDHLYTDYRAEGAGIGLNDEGVGFRLYSGEGKNLRALYRCYDKSNGDHFLSTAENCESAQTDQLLGYVSTLETANATLPLYRCYGNGRHLITVNKNECSALEVESVLGYSP